MIETWREWLYPLGYLSSIAFGGRFLFQWLISEKQQKSIVTPGFWKLSFVGNLLLLIHSFIQMQFHVCAIQACNTVISWRNLNLMRLAAQQISFQSTILLIVSGIFVTFLAFALQGVLVGEETINWFRLPVFIGQNNALHFISPLWHLIGIIGLVLFSSRFWIQWWCAEKQKSSYLGPAFWWLSLLGGALSLIYFVKINDPVNALGPAVGMIPYIRNLMLIKNQRRHHTPATALYDVKK